MQASEFGQRIWSADVAGRVWHAWLTERRGDLVAIAVFSDAHCALGLPLFPNLWWDSAVDHTLGRIGSPVPPPVIEAVVARVRALAASGVLDARWVPASSGTFPVAASPASAPRAPPGRRRAR